MKFNRKSKDARRYDRIKQRRDWNLWFAWKPVQMSDEQMVWMENVYRRADDAYAKKPKWQYKSKEEFFTDALKS